LLVRIGWGLLGGGLMILGLLVNGMVGGALWAHWGHGATAFYVSAAIAAGAGGALFTLGFLFDGTVQPLRARILGFWLLWSWLCLCFRFSVRLGTADAEWPFYLFFVVPVVVMLRNRSRRRGSEWTPRTVAEMQAGVPAHMSRDHKEPKIP